MRSPRSWESSQLAEEPDLVCGREIDEEASVCLGVEPVELVVLEPAVDARKVCAFSWQWRLSVPVADQKAEVSAKS